jgi:phage tail-like protein
VPLTPSNPGNYIGYTGYHDPFRNYYFSVVIDGKSIRGISKISSLKKSTDVILFREGGESDKDHKTPGRTSYSAITLERPLTTDTDFVDWSNMLYQCHDSKRDLSNYRRNLQIVILDLTLTPILKYNLYDCWVSEYSISELDSSANDLATECIRIEIGCWELDKEFLSGLEHVTKEES